MATDIAVLGEQAPGHRELISLAKNPSLWTRSAAMEMIAGNPGKMLGAALSRLYAELAPVPTAPADRQGWNDAVGERLKRLGAKIAPHLSEAQGNVWRDAMTEALSDLPALVALTAAKRAMHKPMRFMSSVESIVRSIADEMIAERKAAIGRMMRLKEEIERAAAPQMALPPPPACEPFSVSEIRSMNKDIRRLGLSAGWLTQAEIDAADPPAEAEAPVEQPEDPSVTNPPDEEVDAAAGVEAVAEEPHAEAA